MTSSASAGDQRAEHSEAVSHLDQAEAVTIVPGVTLHPLVDARVGAENLVVGVLTIEPKARYPHYSRPFTEVLTLLEGDAAVDVEDRRYRLGPLDSAAIPRQIPRRVVNLSTIQPAVFHIALAASSPLQMWVNARFEPHEVPLSSTDRQRGVWIGRNDQAIPNEIAPQAIFQKLCGHPSADSLISGDIGRFEPGARFPCHRVEFDGTITVVEGMATYVVEGRRLELSKGTTVFVPRGRCHYIINLTLDPLVIISVHAGDRAERIVVDENCCHPERRKRRPQARGDQ